jgi:hypothetical protein
MDANLQTMSIPVNVVMMVYLSLAPALHQQAGGRRGPIPCHVRTAGRDDALYRRQKLREAQLSLQAFHTLSWRSTGEQHL